MISYNFSPLQMWRLPSQQPDGMAPPGNLLKYKAALTISLLEVCVEYPYNNLCLECNVHQLLYSFVIYDFLQFFTISHPTSKLVSETCLWSV